MRVIDVVSDVLVTYSHFRIVRINHDFEISFMSAVVLGWGNKAVHIYTLFGSECRSVSSCSGFNSAGVIQETGQVVGSQK